MKRKSITKLVAFSMAAILTLTGVAPVFAAEAAIATEEVEEKSGFKLVLGEAELEVKNDTQRSIASAVLEEVVLDEETSETEDSGEEAEEDTEVLMNLVLTEDTGAEHIFEGVKAEEWKEPVLKEEYGILYIRYKDAMSKEQEAAETAEETSLEKPVTVWTSANVHIRESADKESESLKILPMGTQCEILAVSPVWFLVESDEFTGYVHHRYVTEDKEAVDRALEEKRLAEEAAALAAAEEAARQEAWEQLQAQQSVPQQSAPQQDSGSSERYEVSRETIPSCDDPDHGTIYITYSDGSVEVIEY